MSNNAPAASEQKNSGRKAPRVVTIRLRLPALIAALVLFLVGMAWIFFLGVLAGRGYYTEEQIGALAAFMPSPPVAEATGSMNVTAGGTDDEGDLNALFERGKLLTGEDLDFKGSLRSPAEDAPGGGTAGRGSEVGVTPLTPAEGGTEVFVASPSEPLYEYVYQVSSLNEQHQAMTLKQKLADAGIAAQIELYKTQTATWYRVLVSFRGKNSELPAFINRLEQLNLKQPLLRKKQAISG